MELIDPTSELAPETRQPLPRLLASNTDVTIGLLDISKPKGDVFLNRVEDLLQQRGNQNPSVQEADVYARRSRCIKTGNCPELRRGSRGASRLRFVHVVQFA